jgi:hypothetical protein
MKNVKLFTAWVAGAASLALAAVILSGCACCDRSARGAQAEPTEPGFLYRTNYHGWEDSIWVSNGRIEAIITPSIGRVMQLRFAGEADGPFWENEALSGQPARPERKVWQDFGGERVWPSPQKTWSSIMSTNWPPPIGFDGSPAEAVVDGWVVTLVYPSDPEFGIQVTRRIELLQDKPAMEIQTRYQKVAGRTLDAGIWVMTQLKDPEALYTRLPLISDYPQGFQPMSGRIPPSLQIRDRLLSLRRDTENPYRIGLEVGSVVWMDESTVLKIDSPRLPYRNYPENGASMILSTQEDPTANVQIDQLGPVQQLRDCYDIVNL